MSYKIIGKYIKKLNFNIPKPKTFFLLSKNIASTQNYNKEIVQVSDPELKKHKSFLKSELKKNFY